MAFENQIRVIKLHTYTFYHFRNTVEIKPRNNCLLLFSCSPGTMSCSSTCRDGLPSFFSRGSENFFEDLQINVALCILDLF